MITRLYGYIRQQTSLVLSEHGQGLIEYALLLMLVAFIVLALILVFGSSVGDLYSNIVRAI